jgi:hypothetical protein
MKRLATTIFACLLLAVTVFAISVHFKSGPTFSDNGLTLTATGSISGLGNGNVAVAVDATGTPVVACTSPGGNQSPGQNPASVTLSGITSNVTRDKNGNVLFTVTTATPSQPTPKAAGCPNNNWDATITDVKFSTATITVFEGSTSSGNIVLQQTFPLP